MDHAIIPSLLGGERFFIQNGMSKNLPKPIFSVALNIHWPDPSLVGTAKANTNNKSFDSSGSNESEWILESLMSWSGTPK